MAPRKLIRNNIKGLLNGDEFAWIGELDELNPLYALKVKEELLEIQASEHKDILEFADLIEVAYQFAEENGFSKEAIDKARLEKVDKKGKFGTLVLTNLNPNNPSNKMYFDDIHNRMLPREPINS